MKALLAAGVAALATSGTASAQELEPATDREVQFIADGTMTYGTIHLPIDHFLHTAGTPVGDQVLAPAARHALTEFWP